MPWPQLGRRFSKTVGGVTSTYIYEGQNLIAERGAATVDSVFGPGIDEPLAMTSGGSSYDYSVDGLGSIAAMTTTSGALSRTYTFDSWGIIAAQTGSIANPFTYTSRESSEVGLMYYRARYYNPNIGRFVSEDPLRLRAGSINFYIYAVNIPSRLVDSFGLCCTELDRSRELVLAMDIADSHRERTFWSQAATGKLFDGNGGCGFNASGLAQALGCKLNCWKAERVDAGPRVLDPNLFEYSRTIPHSFVRLTPINT